MRDITAATGKTQRNAADVGAQASKMMPESVGPLKFGDERWWKEFSYRAWAKKNMVAAVGLEPTTYGL